MTQSSDDRNGQSVSVEAELSPDTYEALKNLAEKRGLNANTVIQQAINTEKLLSDNVGLNDELLIKKADNTYSKVRFSRTRRNSRATIARCCRRRCSTSWNASACLTRCADRREAL